MSTLKGTQCVYIEGRQLLRMDHIRKRWCRRVTVLYQLECWWI